MTMSGYWRRIIIVNAVTAVAAFGLFGGFLSGQPWPDVVRSLVASFIFANCIGGLLGLAMPRLFRWVPVRGAAARWIVRLCAIGAITVIGVAVAGIVLVAVGWIRPSQYLNLIRWSLWISLLVATAACLFVIAYESLRNELDTTSLALRTKERDEAEARRLAAEAQLASLEARVQPHFLFNTLNSIAELIHENPKGAERMTGQLASLLRSSLDEQPGRLIPLRDELAVVRDYLDIERVRFGDRLRFDVMVDEGLEQVCVPRLAVQTLVENTVKYAVSRRRDSVDLVIRAAAVNGRVSIAVEDDGPGFDPTSLPEGHGLALLRSRLAMTFGDRAALRIDSRAGRTCVTIEIPA
jgi:signal transduction histidine kinase